ncbi:MAG: C-terminal helicase domain-containing protein, partial [Dermatophilaceae bacterium]|nr:C-terminal helicase domain-containing protein [Dermatophilaceae bacterium]
AKQLNASGVPAVELHGNLSQNARTRNMDDFHSGRAQTLVATDIAARGIHVDDVALVIHADPPVEHKAYLHRSGRTARAGNEGTVVTMMLDEQVRDVRDLTRKAGIKPTTTRVALGHPLLTELAPGERSYAGGLVREAAPVRAAGAGSRGGSEGTTGSADSAARSGGRPGRGRGRGRGRAGQRPEGAGTAGSGGTRGSGRSGGGDSGRAGGRPGQGGDVQSAGRRGSGAGGGSRRRGGAAAGGSGRRSGAGGGSATVYSTSSSGSSAASFSAGTRAGTRRPR